MARLPRPGLALSAVTVTVLLSERQCQAKSRFSIYWKERAHGTGKSPMKALTEISDGHGAYLFAFIALGVSPSSRRGFGARSQGELVLRAAA